MASQRDVRRIARSLPGTVEEKDRFAFAVVNKGKPKGYAWVWLERLHPKKARVPNPEVLAVRVANLEEKELLLSSDDGRLFTEPHYNGYPAVLVRLQAVTVAELEALVTAAWRCQAPAPVVEAFDAGRKPGRPRRSPARKSQARG
jgi:hypothetical protein